MEARELIGGPPNLSPTVPLDDPRRAVGSQLIQGCAQYLERLLECIEGNLTLCGVHGDIVPPAASPTMGVNPQTARLGSPFGARLVPRAPRSGLHEAAANRVVGQFDAVAHAELLEHVGAVAVDRLLADDELLGDLLAREALGDQLDDLEFARA
jgi:hypothetical protein